MKNVSLTYNADKTKLTIEVDLTKTFGPSASGKTTIIASTEGNAELESPDGRGEIRLGLNVYEKK